MIFVCKYWCWCSRARTEEIRSRAMPGCSPPCAQCIIAQQHDHEWYSVWVQFIELCGYYHFSLPFKSCSAVVNTVVSSLGFAGATLLAGFQPAASGTAGIAAASQTARAARRTDLDRAPHPTVGIGRFFKDTWQPAYPYLSKCENWISRKFSATKFPTLHNFSHKISFQR